MSFCFTSSDETVEAGLRRIVLEELDGLLAMLRSHDVPPEKVVHKVRIRCKAVRGLLRLVRPAFPDYEIENAGFRDVAAGLAGLRDRHVLAHTLDRLVHQITDVPGAVGITALRRALIGPRTEEEPLSPSVEALLHQCTASLKDARERAASWSLTPCDDDVLILGMGRTYRRAYRGMGEVMAARHDAHLSHEWRKHIKYHGQHMRLLQAIAPALADERVQLATRLSDVLGERHDLDVFSQVLADRGGAMADPAIVEALAVMAQQHAAQLAAKAGTLGARLFDEKPSAFVDQWHGFWKSRH